MEFLRKNKLATIILIILLIVWGSWGYTTYSQQGCVNENAESWEHYRLVECSIYKIVEEDKRTDPSSEGEIAVDPFINLEYIEGAHVNTFDEIDESYARDKKGVFYGIERIDKAHTDTFTQIDGEYYGDRKSVYWRGELVIDADPKSMTLFTDDGRYAKDAEHEFFSGVQIEYATASTSNQFLVSPFDGDEVTSGQDKQIFWKRDVSVAGDRAAIALRTEDGELSWILNNPIDNTGSYVWNPEGVEENIPYTFVFYLHSANGKVTKVIPPNIFTIKEIGKPDISLSVDFRDDEVVYVNVGEVSYVSWAASNVYSCALRGGGVISEVGHSYMKFFNEGVDETNDLLYAIECVAHGGGVVSDEIKIKLQQETTVE